MQAVRLIAIATGMLAIAGCQGFPGFAHRAQSEPAALTDTGGYFAQLVDEGRLHLRANRPGQAIVAFRRASYHPEFAGEAYNGMAVSYEMIGRSDLAERFFLAAIEADPGDGRFARNLARLESSRTRESGDQYLAQAAPSGTASEAAQELPAVPQVARSEETISDAQLPSRVQRISDREIVIGPRDDWTARINAGERERPAIVHVGGRRDTSLAAADPSPTRYPISFAISDIPAQTPDSGERESTAGASAFRIADGSISVRVSGALRPRDVPAYPVSFRLDPR